MGMLKLFELASRMDKVGIAVTRVGLIIVLLWIGGLKAFRYEADGIVPFVANSPLMNFLYADPGDYKVHKNPEGALVPQNRSWHEMNRTYEFAYGLGAVIVLFNFAVAGGRSAFQTNCMQCHGAGGAGGTGFPNLVDDDWLWGGKIEQIHQTIQFGVRNANEKSRNTLMPRFGVDGLLTAEQVGAVTDYVLSLSGKGKATPEGTKIFQEQCVTCHQANGTGNQEMGAPNLTDGLWLYGGSRDAIYRTIFYARNGSMPAWGERLDDATIKMLALYVHSLGGGK